MGLPCTRVLISFRTCQEARRRMFGIALESWVIRGPRVALHYLGSRQLNARKCWWAHSFGRGRPLFETTEWQKRVRCKISFTPSAAAEPGHLISLSLALPVFKGFQARLLSFLLQLWILVVNTTNCTGCRSSLCVTHTSID